MYAGAVRFGFRLVHLLVEAPDRRALSRAMKGLGVRIAKALNRVMERSGPVIGDRYHAHILKTPSEVKAARHYMLTNAKRHYGYTQDDPYSSVRAMVEARTWLLRRSVAAAERERVELEDGARGEEGARIRAP